MYLRKQKLKISFRAGRSDGAEARRHRGVTETISERAVVASETAVLYLHRRPCVSFGS